MKSGKNALIKAGLLVVLCSWLIFTAYWFFKSLAWMEYAYPYSLTTYLVVDVASTMGLGFRMVAGLVAIWAVVGLLMGRESLILVKLIGIAVVLEAIFFLTFLPSAFLGFELGGPFFLVESAIPCLVMATILPVSLFKLKSKLTQSTKHYGGAIKWGCIAGISYLIVFWLNFVTQWIGTFIQPESWTSAYPGYEINASVYPGYGINYVTNHPLNLFTFLLTSVGLLALAIFFLWSVFPTIRDPTKRPNLRKIGATLTFLGAYFIIIILFFMTFGYVGGRSIWIMWFIYNNLDNWCVALPALGIPLMLGKHN